MANKKSDLYLRVVQLMGRGKNQQQVINSIRATKGGRNVNTRYIKAAIEKYKAAEQAASRISNIGPATPISKNLNNKTGKGAKTVRVAFHFNFDFPSDSKSGRVGRQAVHMTIDVPAGTTKSELSAILKELAHDWIDNQYGGDRSDRNAIRITIDSIFGV